jgi:hypothetical protein
LGWCQWAQAMISNDLGSGPWVEALRLYGYSTAAAQHTAAVVATAIAATRAAAARAQKAAEAANEAYMAAAHAQHGKLRRLATRCAC